MSSPHLEITKTLQKAVANCGLTLPVQYEGVSFNTNKQSYCRAKILPEKTQYSTLGALGCNYNSGILQIDILVPNNTGVDSILANVGIVEDYFYTNREFNSTNLNVRIELLSIEQRINIDGYLVQPISINYFCYSDRL